MWLAWCHIFIYSFCSLGAGHELYLWMVGMAFRLGRPTLNDRCHSMIAARKVLLSLLVCGVPCS